jgi:hypothetical protein
MADLNNTREPKRNQLAKPFGGRLLDVRGFLQLPGSDETASTSLRRGEQRPLTLVVVTPRPSTWLPLGLGRGLFPRRASIISKWTEPRL